MLHREVDRISAPVDAGVPGPPVVRSARAASTPAAALPQPDTRRTFTRRLFDIANAAMDAASILDGEPTASTLSRATASSGVALSEWGVQEPLEIWARSLREEAMLNGFGRLAIRWDVARLLRTMVRFQEEEARDPAILAEEIVAPIVITGMPRSGTTFLHSLLGQDRRNKAPLSWQVLQPYPPLRGQDRRRRDTDRQFRAFLRLVPELASLHPLAVDMPQECSEITSHVFRSLRFDTTHHVPEYRRWLDTTGHAEAYRFHRRFLQHLQRQLRTQSPGPWVLKCPDHVFCLSALEETYPDVRLVFVHRDPLKVLPSVARLTELLREPFTRRLDRAGIGRQVVRDWHDGAMRMVAASGRPAAATHRMLHLSSREITTQPCETVAKLYRHFGLELTPNATAAVAGYVARRPTGGYGRNIYHFNDHGIDPLAERERFSVYTDYFDVALECG